MKHLKSKAKTFLTFLVLAVVAVYQYQQENNNNNAAEKPGFEQHANVDTTTNTSDIEHWKSGKWVVLSGYVSRILPDDNTGSRHQKFILKVSNNTTLLIAHNIDLADRVPVQKGDQIKLRGRYEKNNRGGLIHWTHHDPQRIARAGWIEHSSKRYE